MRSPYQISNDPNGYNTLNHFSSERSLSGKRIPVQQPAPPIEETKKENKKVAKEKSAKKEVKKPKKTATKKKK